MRHRSLVLLLGLLLSTALPINAALANETDKTAEFEELLYQLGTADTELEGRTFEKAIWDYWFDQSPTAEVRAALDAGMKRREAYDYETAEKHLDRVIELAPGYAEGYNQRAFVRYLRENHTAAESDLQKALELEPQHFGALSGLFHVLRRQDRQDAAYSALHEALKIHPWAQERHSLPERLWPDSYRAVHSTDQEI